MRLNLTTLPLPMREKLTESQSIWLVSRRSGWHWRYISICYTSVCGTIEWPGTKRNSKIGAELLLPYIVTDGINPLNWWRQHEQSYPLVLYIVMLAHPWLISFIVTFNRISKAVAHCIPTFKQSSGDFNVLDGILTLVKSMMQLGKPIYVGVTVVNPSLVFILTIWKELVLCLSLLYATVWITLKS